LIILALCIVVLAKRSGPREAVSLAAESRSELPGPEAVAVPSTGALADMQPGATVLTGGEAEGMSLLTTDAIAAALKDLDPSIRAAACAAAKQSGDRRLIHTLISAAGDGSDAREKAALLDAADFLRMPTLTETQRAP
jgi:hypothetical protein